MGPTLLQKILLSLTITGRLITQSGDPDAVSSAPGVYAGVRPTAIAVSRALSCEPQETY